eukprot:scpid39436/ scgid31085/ 
MRNNDIIFQQLVDVNFTQSEKKMQKLRPWDTKNSTSIEFVWNFGSSGGMGTTPGGERRTPLVKGRKGIDHRSSTSSADIQRVGEVKKDCGREDIDCRYSTSHDTMYSRCVQLKNKQRHTQRRS